MSDLRLQPLTRAKVASLGEVGRAWQADLPRVLGELSQSWGLVLGRGLPGGSASYVCAARTTDGHDRVLKVVAPDPDLADEAPVLAAAGGRGYVLLHEHDSARRALLLERLDGSLETAGASVDTVLDRLVDTLVEAWRLPLATVPVGGDRAREVLATVLARQESLGQPCPPEVVGAAAGAAERLSAGDDVGAHVVLHGDPHPANAMRVREERPGAPGGHVLIDPAGRRGDPAHDVGVTLRDWTGRLEGSDARDLLEGWVQHAARRSGLDPDRVRDWAYLERVSTGLYLLGFGADRLGRRFLASAAALVS